MWKSVERNAKGWDYGMSDTTMEQKLALVQQVRSNYNKNQYDLINRERILYGKTSARNYSKPFYRSWDNAGTPPEYIQEYGMEDPAAGMESGISFFKLRFLIAMVILAAFIVLDMNGGTFAGLTSGEIFEAISLDYASEIDNWLNDSPAP